MPAATILDLVRVSRFATVASGTRNARAISAVVSPVRLRSVSATRPSIGSAGWQHVKISRRRSSSISSASSNIVSSPASSPICSSSCAPRASRRSRSIARLPATVVNHAIGRCGTPAAGHFRTASTNASCAHSSARSQLPVRRISAATMRPHDSRKAASRARWAFIRCRTAVLRSPRSPRTDAWPPA